MQEVGGDSQGEIKLHAYISIYMYIYIHTYIYMYMYMYIYVYILLVYIPPYHPTTPPYYTLPWHLNTVCRRWGGSQRVKSSRIHIHIYIYIYIYICMYMYVYILLWHPPIYPPVILLVHPTAHSPATPILYAGGGRGLTGWQPVASIYIYIYTYIYIHIYIYIYI